MDELSIIKEIEKELDLEFEHYLYVSENSNTSETKSNWCVWSLKKAFLLEFGLYKINFTNDIIISVEDINCVVEIPQIIEFVKLTSLDLSNNHLTKLPKSIEKLVNLNYLDIGFNQLKEIPEFIGNLVNLTSLDIQCSELTEIPEYIRNLVNLIYLDISWNQITKIPIFIGNLVNLTSLKLSVNQITEIPEFIGNLVNLTSLDISWNELTEIKNFMGNLVDLTYLDVGNNELEEIPEFIGNLVNLAYLDVGSNQLKEIPEFIGNLANLIILDLSDLRINYIPKQLVSLNLKFIFDGSEESSINLENTTLISQDISLFNQPKGITQAFYDGDMIFVSESKIIFLGDGYAGKTTLIKALKGEKTGIAEQRTEGIQINRWKTDIEDIKDVDVRIWDFGGQKTIHTMHKCFLSQKTVYVVVVDGISDSSVHNDIRYWLTNILTFALGSPVVIAINKIDANSRVSINEYQIREEFKDKVEIIDFVKVSALKKENILAFEKSLQKAISQSGTYKRLFNENWLGLKREIEEKNQKDYTLSHDNYIELCEKYNIKFEYLQQSILSFFRDIGILYYYDGNSDSGELEEIRVLNPEWVTNGISRLLLRANTLNGVMPSKEIRDILKKSYDGDLHKDITYKGMDVGFILNVMRQFKISSKLENGDEFIPALLSDNFSEDDINFSKENAIHISYESLNMPEIVIQRVMINKFKELDLKCVYRTVAKFKSGNFNSEALVEIYDQKLDLYVCSLSNNTEENMANGYLFIMDTIIKEIFDELNISFTKMLYYNIDNKTGKIPYEDVIEQEKEDSKRKIYLPQTKQFCLPMELLRQIYTDQQIENIKKEIAKMSEEKVKNQININGGTVSSPSFFQGDHNTANYNISNSEINYNKVLETLKAIMLHDQYFLNIYKDKSDEFKTSLNRVIVDVEAREEPSLIKKSIDYLKQLASNVATDTSTVVISTGILNLLTEASKLF